MALDETILLHFDIDEQPAVNSIKDLRAANTQLRAERDKVNISTKEGKDLVDKLNVAIDKNNKVIKENSSALEKQRQNVGNYSKSIEEAAGNLNIMGTNVGALGKSFSSGLNPYVVAGTAVVTALSAAYAQSTIGARDLTFAQNQLAAATTIVTNEFASLISSAEDGEGALTSVLNSLLNSLGPAGVALAQQSKAIALAKEQLEDLNREELIARSQINERLAENQELLTKVQDSQTEYAEKIHLTGQVISNLTANEDELLKIKEAQLARIDQQLSGDKTNEKLLDERVLKELEISSIRKDTERKVGAIQRLESNLLDTEKQRLKTISDQNALLKIQSERDKQKAQDSKTPRKLDSAQGAITNFGSQEIKLSNDITDVVVRNNELKGESYEDYVNRIIGLKEQEAGAARNLAGTLASIAEEGTEAQKALALITIGINSGIGVSEAVKAGAGIPWPGNLAAILSGITAVLAGVAQAKQALGFAEGGWTGPGSKYKAVGVVHADEYVTPKRIVNSPAAQPHLRALEAMRTGYADGGFVTNSNLQSSQQAMIMVNAIKKLPPPTVAVVDINRVQKNLNNKVRVTSQ